MERSTKGLAKEDIVRLYFDLITAITQYIENHNQNPRVFVWSASVGRILSKIAKCKEVLDAPSGGQWLATSSGNFHTVGVYFASFPSSSLGTGLQ